MGIASAITGTLAGGAMKKSGDKNVRNVGGVMDPTGLGSSFLGGNQGEYATPQFDWNEIQRIKDQQRMATESYGTMAGTERARAKAIDLTTPLYSDVASGKTSIADAIKSIREGGYGEDQIGLHRPEEARAAAMNELATGALTGSQFATEQVQSSPLFGQLYGKDSLLTRTLGEEQRLGKEGFKLQPEDYEAYGQASGDLARMFGAQEQDLTQSMTSRGFGGAASGVAASRFTGLQGSKLEQLANAQRKIADDRMNMNFQRLAQTRSFLGNLAGQAGKEVQNQYGRQVTGRNIMEGQRGMSLDAMAQNAGLQSQGRQQTFAEGMGAYQANRGMLEDKAAAYDPSLFEMIGKGARGGIASGVTKGTGALVGGKVASVGAKPGTPGSTA